GLSIAVRLNSTDSKAEGPRSTWMKIEALHLGMKVRHPQYGVGTVKTIAEHTADIRFETGERTVSPEASGLEPAEAQAAITGLEQPLSVFIKDIVRNTDRKSVV